MEYLTLVSTIHYHSSRDHLEPLQGLRYSALQALDKQPSRTVYMLRIRRRAVTVAER